MSDTKYEETKRSLERIQTFDIRTLPRVEELGQRMNFTEVVPDVERLCSLFRQFPVDALSDLPESQKDTLKNVADSVYQSLGQILQFDSAKENSFTERNNFIANVRNQYQNVFNQIFPIISYGASRQRDFGALEQQFRSAIQRADDQSSDMVAKLSGQNDEAAKILEEIRKVAAEQGVSQQSSYFREESASHDRDSDRWRKWTIIVAAILVVYAIASAYLHRLPGLVPATPSEEIQLGLSKFLVFAVLAYMLFLCARNFLAHKHNAIVNRHRFNALLTFKALADAAGSEEKRDIVLTYAAACIFSPQETGYTKAGSPQSEMPLSLIQTLPKLVSHGSS